MLRPEYSFRRRLLLTFAAFLAIAGLTRAAEEDHSKGVSEDELQQTLDWLDHYLTVQVIFKQEDTIKLRQEVAAMSPKQLQAWLDRTKQLRKRLTSPEWAKTQEFLSDFLSKQAIYSDEEIEQMRMEAAEMTPEQLMGLLDKIENKYAEMTGMQRTTEQRRQLDVAGNDLRIARQKDARQQQQKDAFAARNQYLANQSAAKARAATSRSNTPLFGSSQSRAAETSARSQYRPPAPLIDSRDAARRAVSRSVGGGYGWGW